jgi:hypothetical protein
MPKETETGDGGAERIVTVVTQFMKSLTAPSVKVKLQNGSIVTGSSAGLLIRKKEKKDEVTWNGKITVETEQGSLQIDCEDVAGIS